MGVLKRWEDIRNPSRRRELHQIGCPYSPVKPPHLPQPPIRLFRPYVFQAPCQAFLQYPRKRRQVQARSGGHIGCGTVTRGDSRTHEHSAVDPTAPYPEPAEVSRACSPMLYRELT